MQRALSFLPGDWDAKAITEAQGSSEWREKMKVLFYKEYFKKAPLVGLGYHYDPRLAKTATDVYLSIVKRQAEAGDEFADVRSFIEMRQPHEGVLHALLVSGSIGSFFFVLFCFGFFFYAYRSIAATPPREVTPLQTWCFALLLTQLFAFFLLFGDYTSFLIQVCPITALLVRAETFRRAGLKTRPTLTSAPATYPPPLPSPQLH
jgi:O-antigen ligase